jgi:hypothetical protein
MAVFILYLKVKSYIIQKVSSSTDGDVFQLSGGPDYDIPQGGSIGAPL